MPRIFERAGMRRPQRSAFDLSREQKLTFKIGQLIPTYLEEIVPGDEFRVRTETLLRFSPMVAPIMHRVNVYMHYFYVPNRIIWSQWEDFITEGREGPQEPEFPTIRFGEVLGGQTRVMPDLADYLGIPFLSSSNQQDVSQLPFRAYQTIVRDYYRDQHLVQPYDNDDLDIQITAGNDHQLNMIRFRTWEKDYFTSALPYSQKGDPVGLNADIDYKEATTAHDSNGNQVANNAALGTIGGEVVDDSNNPLSLQNLNDIGIDINELRTSSAIQRWLEKAARGGNRYIEAILNHFGVASDDSRLQRPEYLGGGRQPVVISEVLNTTGTQEAPQGEMAGHGISAGTTNSFQSYFKEHGYVLGIMSVVPKPEYMHGIARHYRRRDRFDFYWPEFANLGEQEILNHEIYANVSAAEKQETFGYQQRFAEYKHGMSSVHGQFRDSLEFWHLARKFDNLPTLSKEFVEISPEDVQRMFADSQAEQVLCQLYHDVKARRPMPYFSDPRLT